MKQESRLGWSVGKCCQGVGVGIELGVGVGIELGVGVGFIRFFLSQVVLSVSIIVLGVWINKVSSLYQE